MSSTNPPVQTPQNVADLQAPTILTAFDATVLSYGTYSSIAKFLLTPIQVESEEF